MTSGYWPHCAHDFCRYLKKRCIHQDLRKRFHFWALPHQLENKLHPASPLKPTKGLRRNHMLYTWSARENTHTQSWKGKVKSSDKVSAEVFSHKPYTLFKQKHFYNYVTAFRVLSPKNMTLYFPDRLNPKRDSIHSVPRLKTICSCCHVRVRACVKYDLLSSTTCLMLSNRNLFNKHVVYTKAFEKKKTHMRRLPLFGLLWFWWLWLRWWW